MRMGWHVSRIVW